MLKFLLVPTFLFAYGCTTTAHIERKLIPDMNINKKEPIVVKEFSGENGKEVSAIIENALLEKGYSLIDRENLLEGAIANNKIPAAAYVVSGKIEEFGPDRNVKVDSVICSKNEGEFQATRTRETRTGTISAQIRFSVPKTSKILLSKKIEGRVSHTSEDLSCENIGPSIKPTTKELMEGARAAFRSEFLKLIEPYFESFEVELFKVSDVPEMKKGNELMQNQRLKEALQLYEQAVHKIEKMDVSDADKGHVFYSYGVALGYLGDERFKENIAKAMTYNTRAYAYEREMRRLIELQPKIQKY